MEHPEAPETSEETKDNEPATESLPVIEAAVESAAASEETSTEEDDGTEKVKPPPHTRPHRTPHHKLDLTDDDNPQLVITWFEKIRIGQRDRLRHAWDEHVLRIDMDATDLIDTRYATRTHLRFSPSETRIHYLRRLHWMSHGPQQIFYVTIWLMGVIMLIWLTQFAPEGNVAFDQILLAAGFGLSAVCTVAVIKSWMRWAYTYLICTDVRIVRIYYPPFKLPPEINSAALTKLQGCKAGSTWFGNMLGYGTIRSATAANAKKNKDDEVDSWLEEGIKYVPEYERLYANLTLAA